MLTPKLGPQALLPKTWLTRSPAHVPSSPISQTRLTLVESHSTYAKRFKFKRNYFQSSTGKRNRIARAKNPRTMLAVAAAAVVGSAGVAGYATSADSHEPQPTASAPTTFKPSFESAVYQIPHPEKQHKGGEDTYLVSSNGLVVGVFDGVGGWAESGVDPRDYAVKLSEGAQDATDIKGYSDPLEVMRHAAKYANRTIGSSTACIVGIEGSNLISANLGDSGYMVVRISPDTKKVELIFKSEEQQHSFNFPYQLGPQSRDVPDDADLLSVPVQHGDLVILGTDGLFDNVDAKRVCRVIETALGLAGDGPASKVSLANLARYIASDAFRISLDPNAITPFTIGSRYRYRGGKSDDITVVVSRVNLEAPSQAASASNATSNTTQSTPSTGSASQTSNNMIQAEQVEESTSETEADSPSFLARLWGLRPWGAAFARL